MSTDDVFGPVIHSYTRAQAIGDGMLVDVSEVAREAGFTRHTVLTRSVWEGCVAWDNADERAYQDESGRLWDVLFMARMAATRAGALTDRVTYKVARIPSGQQATTPEEVELVLHIGPGDAGEPVLTIMWPGED